MPVGRPLTLTPELSERICAVVREGNFRHTAARYLRIPVRTFRRWCEKGRKAKSGPYFEFWHALLEAECEAEIKAVRLVIEAAQADPKHAEWWLERKCHRQWGRKDALAVTGKDGAPLALTLEQRQKAERELQEWERARDGAGAPPAEPPGATP
jgi:hypothetical protein